MDDAVQLDDESSTDAAALISALVMMASLWQRQRILNQTSELLSRRESILLTRRIKERISARRHEGRRYCRPTPQVNHDGVVATPHLGVSQAAFSRICTLIDSDGGGSKDHGWPSKLEVAVFLHWLVSASSLRTIGLRFGMPKSTVNDSVQRVLIRLLHQLQSVVRLPASEDEMKNIGKGLARLAGGHRAFRLAVGCLDTMDVHVRAPSKTDCDDSDGDGGDIYVNGEGVRTVRCQVMCDHQGLFRDVFAGYPGLFDDQQLFVNSPLYAKADFPPQDAFLVAGPTYACAVSPVTIVTPYEEPTSSGFQFRFNACHRAARSAVRWAVDRTKSRWPRVFDPDFDASSTLAPKVLVACAMLHNVCTIADEEKVPHSARFVQQLECEDTVSLSECARELKPRLDHAVSAQVYTPSPQDHLYI